MASSRTAGGLAVVVGLVLGVLETAVAQTAPAPTQLPAQAAGAANSAAQGPANASAVVAISSENCKAANSTARPIIVKTPAAAAELVQQSVSTSCSCSAAETLSSIQRGLRKSNPAGAKIISEIVSKAPAAFQSCYALALAPTGGDGPGNAGNAGKGGSTGAASISGQGSSTVASAGGGIGGTGVGSGAGFGGFGGSGGGSVVSPVHP